MKERPILFSKPMVNAILEGRKTQTRRVLKVKGRDAVKISAWRFVHILWGAAANVLSCKKPVDTSYAGFHMSDDSPYPAYFKCPYGQVGDRLWVRETWKPDENGNTCCITYAADEQKIDIENTSEAADRWLSVRKPNEQYPRMDPAKWRPSIHMPRWASRINLEITNVRVERLNDISEQDAAAEGIVIDIFNQGEPPKHGHFDCLRKYVPAFGEFDPARYKFFRLWESINGTGSWNQNPWVWVIEFKRVKP